MSTDDIPTVTPLEAAGASTDGALLLDVREIDEWTAGHADDTTHVPLMELPARLEELPGDRRIVCICRSGGRSARATQFLRSNGFDAVNMIGGMQAWAAAGLPVVRLDGGSGSVI